MSKEEPTKDEAALFWIGVVCVILSLSGSYAPIIFWLVYFIDHFYKTEIKGDVLEWIKNR